MMASRWGLLGKEALGKDFSVYFNLESGIDPESGTSGEFNRAAFIGVGTPIGKFQLGRQDNVVENVLSPYTFLGNPGQACAVCNVQISSGQRESRYNSALVYFSPEWQGLSLQAGYVSKNDEASVGNLAQKNVWTLGATFKHGPLQMGTVYESKLTDGKNAGASWGVGMKYQFDAFTLSGGYMDNHDQNDGRGVYADIVFPIEAFNIGGQVAYNFDASSPVTDQEIKPMSFALFTTYHFSERTRLYALYGYINHAAQEFAQAFQAPYLCHGDGAFFLIKN